ncbi:Hypothetical predicted protein [Pelobates cultripes]|uniref:Uncharacterized protein n=1 Tax=Pelobates cultripes TaxID=61616 RepID=A0AAD1W4A4_PELCU|nr:Hypothetical predicted protein [Pelobates cultripes]
MGGGRKSKQGAEVALIFRNRKDGGATRSEDGRGSDSDSAASDTSRATTSTPLTKDDLHHLLQEIKANMKVEFDKHLTPIKEGLIDLTHRTTAIEEQLDRTTTCTTTHRSDYYWHRRPPTSPHPNEKTPQLKLQDTPRYIGSRKSHTANSALPTIQDRTMTKPPPPLNCIGTYQTARLPTHETTRYDLTTARHNT